MTLLTEPSPTTVWRGEPVSKIQMIRRFFFMLILNIAWRQHRYKRWIIKLSMPNIYEVFNRKYLNQRGKVEANSLIGADDCVVELIKFVLNVLLDFPLELLLHLVTNLFFLCSCLPCPLPSLEAQSLFKYWVLFLSWALAHHRLSAGTFLCCGSQHIKVVQYHWHCANWI